MTPHRSCFTITGVSSLMTNVWYKLKDELSKVKSRFVSWWSTRDFLCSRVIYPLWEIGYFASQNTFLSIFLPFFFIGKMVLFIIFLWNKRRWSIIVKGHGRPCWRSVICPLLMASPWCHACWLSLLCIHYRRP